MALVIKPKKKGNSGGSAPKRKPKRKQERLVSQTPAGVNQLLPYPAGSLVTCELLIERMSPDDLDTAWDRRYENARAVVAEWINACRDLNLQAFAKATFDVWIGQECGQELGRTMQVTIATCAGLPDLTLLELLRRHPAAAVLLWNWGHQPIELGSFPELRISQGTIEHSWQLNVAFLDLASERFRRWHRLDPEVNDPYRQLSRGASEPGPFQWTMVTGNGPTAGRERNVFIMELANDSEGKGIRITSPDRVVLISDVYDLYAQLELANIDVTLSCFEPFQRLHHVRYVRPALRVYCERFGRTIPQWLADDSIFSALSEKDCQCLFGQPKLGIRKFQPLQPVKGVEVVRRTEE